MAEICGVSQTEIRGGNATNLAFALSSLSAKAQLYCVGDELAASIIAHHPTNCKIKIIEGKPGYTTAIEFPYGAGIANVMLSDVGDVSHFDGSELNRIDLVDLGESDCIALVNWACNSNGNDLAKRVFNLKGRKHRLNFLDPADLSGTEGRINNLLTKIIGKGLIDVVSLNENEARILARVVSVGKLPKSYHAQDLRRISAALHENLSCTVDIHTRIGSTSSTAQETYWANSFGVVTGIVTGAGDVWDAGNIIGHLIHLEAESRLQFANACAHLYVAAGSADPPKLSAVLRFLRERKIALD